MKGLEIDEFSRGKMDATLKELMEGRGGVKHLLGRSARHAVPARQQAAGRFACSPGDSIRHALPVTSYAPVESVSGRDYFSRPARGALRPVSVTAAE